MHGSTPAPSQQSWHRSALTVYSATRRVGPGIKLISTFAVHLQSLVSSVLCTWHRDKVLVPHGWETSFGRHKGVFLAPSCRGGRWRSGCVRPPYIVHPACQRGPRWRPYPVPSKGWLRTRVGHKKHNWVTFCAPAARQNDIPPDTSWELWVCVLQKHATLRL